VREIRVGSFGLWVQIPSPTVQGMTVASIEDKAYKSGPMSMEVGVLQDALADTADTLFSHFVVSQPQWSMQRLSGPTTEQIGPSEEGGEPPAS
jgi:hypothetical protein